MSYQLVERELLPSRKDPQLTMQIGGKIGLNRVAMALFSDPPTRHVWIFYDPIHRMLGLRPALKPDKNAYLIYRGNGEGGSIGAAGFLNSIGWSARTKVTLAATFNTCERMLEVELPTEFFSGSIPFGAAQ